MMDWSAHAMAGVLHQVQDGKLRFIAAWGWKCKSYEANYHSSKGELTALHYAMEKFEKWLQLSQSHVPGPLNVPPDALSRRLDLPEPTNSEFQAGAEFKPQYLLDLALPKAQEWEAGTRLTW